jgi:predicted Rossmann fold nucleotide-binding protein DprA/Smf involved in DNA uptake
VEANYKSGSLITADYAQRQGRDIFAFPGSPESDCAKGTNALIRKGAKLVVCAEDILEEYELLYPDRIFTENIALRKHRYKAEVSDFVMEEAPIQQEEEIPAPKEEKKRTPTKKRKEKTALQTESAPAVKEEARKIEDSCDNADYREILSVIKNDMSAEEMAALLSAKRGESCDIGTLLANLTMMEIEGLICAVPGGKYRLA